MAYRPSAQAPSARYSLPRAGNPPLSCRRPCLSPSDQHLQHVLLQPPAPTLRLLIGENWEQGTAADSEEARQNDQRHNSHLLPPIDQPLLRGRDALLLLDLLLDLRHLVARLDIKLDLSARESADPISASLLVPDAVLVSTISSSQAAREKWITKTARRTRT